MGELATAKKPKSLNKAVLKGPVTLTIVSLNDLHDMPAVDGIVHEDLFVVLGKDAEIVYYAGTAEVPAGTPKPVVGESWTFAEDGDTDDTFPTGKKNS